MAYRAHLATEPAAIALLQVDASDDSRPILQRCGFVAVTTTTPYVFTPSGVRGSSRRERGDGGAGDDEQGEHRGRPGHG